MLCTVFSCMAGGGDPQCGDSMKIASTAHHFEGLSYILTSLIPY